MKINEKRDRTYKGKLDNDSLDEGQYKQVSIVLMLYHCILEIVYVLIGCTPMAIINIFSILCYIISYYLASKSLHSITIWIMLIEVYFHVILATVFLGIECGFILWLFGTFCSIFLPYFSPTLTRQQQFQIASFGTLIIVTFITLTFCNKYGFLPTEYKASTDVAERFYFNNSIVGFVSILIYTSVYTSRMSAKSAQLQIMAEHDYLTGIYNRQRLQRILYSEAEREQEIDEYKLAVCIMDIDFFKNVNDTYGHMVGDIVLKEIAKIFEKHEKEGLIYGRWGGEEFLLIAPDDCSFDVFCTMLETIRIEIAEHDFKSENETIHITASFGAACSYKGITIEQLIHQADSRLYEAKNSGKNKVVSR